jgi:protein-disulfide isomerase
VSNAARGVRLVRRLLFVTLVPVVVTAGCSRASGDAEVVARIGNRAVTLQELDDLWRSGNPAQHAEVAQTTYDARRRVLEGIVAESLLADAAGAAGVSIDQFEAAEIQRRASPVTDAEVEAFYEANLGQMDGHPLEEMAVRIRAYLQDQRLADARHRLLADLQQAGPPVHVTLEPPRRHVEIRPTDPVMGDSSAPVTLVEFSDYDCPFCRQVVPTLKQLAGHYGDRLRIVWKDFPLTQIHPDAFKAAEAAHCAGDQERYWEYHDLLFANQRSLQPDRLVALADDLGLDRPAFDACLDSSTHAPRVRDGLTQGTRLGVNSTPTIFINGRLIAGAHPYETFAAIVEEELARAR